MRVTLFDDPAPVAGRVLDWLQDEPVVHNVLGTVLGAAVATPERFDAASWWLVENGDGIAGWAMLTPPFSLTLSRMSDAALDALLAAVDETRPDLPGVVGTDVAERFRDRWVERHGVQVRPGMAQKMYELDEVVAPFPAVPGAMRLAVEADRDLVAVWMSGFAADSGALLPAGPEVMAERAVQDGRLHLWHDPGDPPVALSMAGMARPVGGVVRVGPVYTPPGLRGRGYASGLVAALSQHALDQGAPACMLFTDVANPTSNKIYQRIGYRYVGDFTEYRFGA